MSRGDVMKKIVVVEDDAVSARMLRDYLDAHGYAVSVATTGTDGLARFAAVQPDLMVVDVALPLKSGFELCFEVKRSERGRATPVILMSAALRDDHAHRYAVDDLQAAAWLSKPFELRALLAEVERLIGPGET
jgi:DNA-binding response OmpR family regulator